MRRCIPTTSPTCGLGGGPGACGSSLTASSSKRGLVAQLASKPRAIRRELLFIVGILALTPELSDAGGPRRSNLQVTCSARIRSSDFVGPLFHLNLLNCRQRIIRVARHRDVP